MSSVLRDVREGFVLAMQRPHLVILDMVAKLVWITLTVALFGLAGIWFASKVELTQNDVLALQSDIPALVGLTLVQSVIAQGSSLVAPLAVAAILSIGGWVLIEAFVRGGLLPLTDRTFVKDALIHFPRFLWVGLLRRTILGLGVGLVVLIVLGPLLTVPMGEWGRFWPDVQWAALAGLGMLVLLAFGLMTVETLIRSDAVGVLGVDPSGVVGIVFVLALVESAVVLAAAVAATLIIQRVGSLGGPVVVGIFLTGALSAGHSYLLLVRYSAVGIMRRNSRDGVVTEHASDF